MKRIFNMKAFADVLAFAPIMSYALGFFDDF